MMKLTIKKIRLEEDFAILCNEQLELFIINPLGIQILECLSKEYSKERIIETLLANYEINPNKLNEDIEEFITLLHENHLLTLDEE